jgi:hypothetical protein
MTSAFEDLIHGYLDGRLSSEQEKELGDWVKASRENACAFADAIYLHDAMRNVAVMRRDYEATIATPRPQRTPSGARRVLIGAGLAGIVAALLIIMFWTNSSSAKAAAELQRLIQAPDVSTDRTYRINSLDPSPTPIEARQAPIDGATLYVRAPDKYVLVRHFPDGRKYVTGSDGERNWAAPPDGAVRLSRDPFRFRWPLPGHQHDIPFVNLRSDLVELRKSYDLATLPPQANGWKGLLAERKSPEHRGPQRVELWYGADTGVIHRMVFDGLSQARGGPKSVAIDFVNHDALAEDFFLHGSHHDPGRRVIEED